MNQARTTLFVGLTLVVLGVFSSPGCQSDRQTIFTAPRSGMTPIDSSVTARMPAAEAERLSSKNDPQSNRVDVPILNPN